VLRGGSCLRLVFPLEVGASGWMDACLRDRDSVQGAVELAVAAAVEPVASVLAAAGFEWCDAGVAGESGVGVEAFDRADLAEQLGGAERAAAGQGKQRRRGLLDPGLELAVEGEGPCGSASGSGRRARVRSAPAPSARCHAACGRPAQAKPCGRGRPAGPSAGDRGRAAASAAAAAPASARRRGRHGGRQAASTRASPLSPGRG